MEKYFYKTVLEHAEFELEKIKWSKFIWNIFHVESKSDVSKYLEYVKEKHKDARHHCYAYRYWSKVNFDLFGNLEISAIQTKENDAGEPSNTAWKPILTQIQANDLHNVLIVVSRYFGWTLLWVGGLIQAYGECAKQTIIHSQIEKIELTEIIFLKFNYSEIPNIINLLNKCGAKIISQKNDEQVILKVEINKAYLKNETILRYQTIKEKDLEYFSKNS